MDSNVVIMDEEERKSDLGHVEYEDVDDVVEFDDAVDVVDVVDVDDDDDDDGNVDGSPAELAPPCSFQARSLQTLSPGRHQNVENGSFYFCGMLTIR